MTGHRVLPLRDDPARERGWRTRHRPVRRPGHERPAPGGDEVGPSATVPMTGVYIWDQGARSAERRRPPPERTVAFWSTDGGRNPSGRAAADRN